MINNIQNIPPFFNKKEISPPKKAFNLNPIQKSKPSYEACNALRAIAFSGKKDKLKEIKGTLEICFQDIEYKLANVSGRTPEEYISAIRQGGFKVKELKNIGGESVIFELEDGSILKLSPDSFKYGVKGVTLPELSRGKIVLDNNKDFYFLIQEKVNVGGISEDEFNLLKEKAKKEGCPQLTDCVFEDGSIKQSNFGWRINKKGERECFIIDMGVPKRGPERYFYEELIRCKDKKEISAGMFSGHMFNVIWDHVSNSDKDYTDIRQYQKEVNEVADEFIERVNYDGMTPLDAIQAVFKDHGLNALVEFEI